MPCVIEVKTGFLMTLDPPTPLDLRFIWETSFLCFKLRKIWNWMVELEMSLYVNIPCQFLFDQLVACLLFRINNNNLQWILQRFISVTLKPNSEVVNTTSRLMLQGGVSMKFSCLKCEKILKARNLKMNKIIHYLYGVLMRQMKIESEFSGNSQIEKP